MSLNWAKLKEEITDIIFVHLTLKYTKILHVC